jgi:hypothetical protein
VRSQNSQTLFASTLFLPLVTFSGLLIAVTRSMTQLKAQVPITHRNEWVMVPAQGHFFAGFVHAFVPGRLSDPRFEFAEAATMGVNAFTRQLVRTLRVLLAPLVASIVTLFCFLPCIRSAERGLNRLDSIGKSWGQKPL